LRPTHTVVFCAIDDLIPPTGKPLSGFPDFLDGLSQAGIPCVWVTSRNRHQLDSTIRKLAHADPFIAEGGSCCYFFEDYFHLKPAHTVRLGRFLAIPVAKPLPAASEGLELVTGETGIEVVPLRSLSPRELIQNSGLPKSDAEAIRQRDFDELFFFAGASDQDIARFGLHATHLKLTVRPHGSLWSLSAGANLLTCVRDLRKLYERAMHKPPFCVALSTSTDQKDLFPACDRAILLADRNAPATPEQKSDKRSAPLRLPLFQAETWERSLTAIKDRQF